MRKKHDIMVIVLIALLGSTASFASCTAKDDKAASQYEQATFIPQATDNNDAAMWATADGDTDDTGADIFYVVSTWEKDWTTEDGIYHSLWMAMQDDPEQTAVVRSRQLHIYRNGVKVLVLAGKSAPKIIRDDSICELLQIERIKWMEQRFNHALTGIKDGSAGALKAIKEDVAELSKYYGSELWKQDFAADEAGNLPSDLKRGVLTEDGIWNLLSDYREIQKTKQ